MVLLQVFWSQGLEPVSQRQEERQRKAQERAEAERKREEAGQLGEVKTRKTQLPLAYVSSQ